MLSVSEPSIGSNDQLVSFPLIFDPEAAFPNSSSSIPGAALRPRKYWLKNWSPSDRPNSTAATCWRVFSSKARLVTACPCKLASSLSRSSADPPGGNNNIPAAIRLAPSKTPISARSTNCGLLKFLSIIHRKSKLVNRILLRRRLRALHCHRAEQRGFVQMIQQHQKWPRILRAHLHIEHHLVLRSNLRQAHRDDARFERHHRFQIAKNL